MKLIKDGYLLMIGLYSAVCLTKHKKITRFCVGKHSISKKYQAWGLCSCDEHNDWVPEYSIPLTDELEVAIKLLFPEIVSSAGDSLNERNFKVAKFLIEWYNKEKQAYGSGC